MYQCQNIHARPTAAGKNLHFHLGSIITGKIPPPPSFFLPLTPTFNFFLSLSYFLLLFIYLLPLSYHNILSLKNIYINISVLGVRICPRDHFQADKNISNDQLPQHRCHIDERRYSATKKIKPIKCSPFICEAID